MHVRELVEFGALLAAHGPALIKRGFASADRPLQQYWVASRCRLDRWAYALRHYRSQVQTGRAVAAWRRVRPTLEEILASELLTRVWAAVCTAHDRQHGTRDLEPVCRTALAGHMEARNRALNIIVFGQGFAVQEGMQLNRLRLRVERWTDVLLARLLDEQDVADLAFLPARAREFREDHRQELRSLSLEEAWALTHAALGAAFQHGLCESSPNGGLNRRIAAAMLACFPTDVLDATSTAQSVWMLRLDQATDDLESLVDELLCDGARPSPILTGGRPRSTDS